MMLSRHRSRPSRTYGVLGRCGNPLALSHSAATWRSLRSNAARSRYMARDSGASPALLSSPLPWGLISLFHPQCGGRSGLLGVQQYRPPLRAPAVPAPGPRPPSSTCSPHSGKRRRRPHRSSTVLFSGRPPISCLQRRIAPTMVGTSARGVHRTRSRPLVARAAPMNGSPTHRVRLVPSRALLMLSRHAHVHHGTRAWRSLPDVTVP
jgi:hypothetical protein